LAGVGTAGFLSGGSAEKLEGVFREEVKIATTARKMVVHVRRRIRLEIVSARILIASEVEGS